MQPGCDEIEFLISKYVDGEATTEERAQIDMHVAGCDSCAYRLTSFMEMAALFSDAPTRQPDPQLRTGVFTEIRRMKEAELQREAVRSAPRPLPAFIPPQPAPRSRSLAARIWSVGSPFALMGTAVAAVFLIMTLAVPAGEVRQSLPVASLASPVIPGGVPTKPASEVMVALPPPVGTQLAHASTYAPATLMSATVRSTATFARDLELELAEPTAIIETGNPLKFSTWHTLRDPAFGYSISYPPNWWTRVSGSVRYFYPWGPGGSRYAPYWIEFRVQANPKGYTADTANDPMFGGACTLEKGMLGGGKCLRRSYSDGNGFTDELYAFDPTHIYILRARGPQNSKLGDFQTRWQDVQRIFARMSGTIALPSEGSSSPWGHGPFLFLNGGDLWSLNADGSGATSITRGYAVREFALSPDLRHVAFSASNDLSDPHSNANYLYIADTESEGPVSPQLLASNLTLYDLAWYDDRYLLAIAKGRDAASTSYPYGIYRIPAGPGVTRSKSETAVPQLLTSLESDMTARGLSVSPDRQLITFIAPYGAEKGTDVYGVRPDGSDLRKVVSHSDAMPPALETEDALTRDTQAIKSYTWLDGALENGRYRFDMLFTSGAFSSPNFHPGGFLYSARSAGRGTLLDPFSLDMADAEKVQIVHVAYSQQGKVALAGFYPQDPWAETLAGLWTADLANGNLSNLTAQPMPPGHTGIADMQWSPDGRSLIYRQVIPSKDSDRVSRYDGDSAFKMVRLDPRTGESIILYDPAGR